MFSTEAVNRFETPSTKENMIPKCNSVQNQRHLQLFCKDLSKINIPDECGWTPLYRTVVAGDIFSATLLLNNGADPNIQCTMGETPLYQAVDMEKIDHIKLLLKNGADPNITNDDGLSPLHAAVYKQNVSIVKILLKYGANPNLKSKLYQQTPLHLAIKNNTDPMILLLLVQFNGSLLNEDKFKKKPIDYTHSKEMQSTIEKLKFGQEKIKIEHPVQSFQTPRKKYDWTPSNVYSNTIRTQSHAKNIVIEGSNAVLQNPGNLKYTIINGKNSVGSVKNNANSNTGNTKVIETVKKGLFTSSETTKIKTNINSNINENDNKENIDTNSTKADNYIKDIKQKNTIIKLLKDKENICPNNNISFSITNTKTGKFGSIQEENSLYESRQNNNSLKPQISKKNSFESISSDKDKNNNHNFSFSTNTFNNNNSKKKSYLSQSTKNEEIDENNENNENVDNNNLNEENKNSDKNKSNKTKIKKDNINININSTNKKKIIIKSYYNKEKKESNNYFSNTKKKRSSVNSNNNNDNNNDYLYEKIIKKSITKIEIYDDDKVVVNESINKTKKQDVKEEDSIIKSPNTSLYNKPKIKSKFNLKKSVKNSNMRPSIELYLNKSNSSVDNNALLPIRNTFSKKMKNGLNKKLSFHIKKMPTGGQIKMEKNIKSKIKSNKTNSFSRRTSMTSLGASRNETIQNQNSLWKFLNDIISNEKTLCNSILTNNINSDIDNEYETNYKYPIYEWLKEINLHCYYSLFKEKRIFSMDKVITNLKTGKYNINKSDIKKIGILIPGHIYRIITKLEIDSGKIKENISNYLLKNQKRMSGKELNITKNTVSYCCGCCSTNEQIHSFNKYKKMFNLDAWLNKIKMIKYKYNFIENGFDLFEFFVLQMFSTIPVDDYIIREELKIENDKDRDIILLRLNKDVKYIMQKTDGILGYNNSYEIGEQKNFDDNNNNVYEFDTSQDEKNTECIII